MAYSRRDASTGALIFRARSAFRRSKHPLAIHEERRDTSEGRRDKMLQRDTLFFVTKRRFRVCLERTAVYAPDRKCIYGMLITW